MLLESCWCSARVTAEGIRDVWSKSRNAAHSTVTFAKKRDGDAMWVLIISFSQPQLFNVGIHGDIPYELEGCLSNHKPV